MSATKRKVYRVLKWVAIVAGLGGALVSILIGVNAFRVHFMPLTPYYNSVTMTYDGYIYDFNVVMNVNLMFPNGTVIASNTDFAIWPLGLYPNSLTILDVSLNYSQSAIDWSKANNQPLIVFTIVEVWFNLPVGGQNILITPVTIYNLYPIYPQ